MYRIRSSFILDLIYCVCFLARSPKLSRLFLPQLPVRVCVPVSSCCRSFWYIYHSFLQSHPISTTQPLQPTTGRQHYRLYTIKNIPSLKVLDYVKISKSERDRAERLANSAAGAALEADVQGEQQHQSSSTAKTFVPGEGLDTQKAFTAIFTAQEKEQIRELVANASSPAEIEEIEQSVKRGVLPLQLQHQQNRKRSLENDHAGATSEENNYAENRDADDQHVGKKIRNGDT